jgi:hypothetical protein
MFNTTWSEQMADNNFTPHEPSYTVDEFCTVERVSRVKLYEQWKHGKGPRFYWNGKSRRITHRARLDWQDTMEAEAERGRKELEA